MLQKVWWRIRFLSVVPSVNSIFTLQGCSTLVEAKKKGSFFNICPLCEDYWISLLLIILLEQIWYWCVVSGKWLRILKSEFSNSDVSLVICSATGETAPATGCFPFERLPPLLPEGCGGGQLSVQPFSLLINNWVKEACFNIYASNA